MDKKPIKVERHYKKCSRLQREPPMRVANEHIRVIPDRELVPKLQEGLLEDFLADDIHHPQHCDEVDD